MLASSSGGSIGRALEMIDEDYLSLRNQMMDRLSDERMKNPLQLLSFVNDFGQDRKIILERLDIMRICFRMPSFIKKRPPSTRCSIGSPPDDSIVCR